MQTANVHQAKTQLSKLLDAAERGEEVVITRRGSGVTRFRLVPEVDRPRSLLGAMAGEIVFADDYDEADAEVLAMFEESINRPDET
ncbi:type II toxin-antitoxin system prevent-host-death family antitoxin [Klenkia sp. LSe6-5]|uniref:Antitoxin n=1 Tax=Klenkia sesuvii TaxID=3103137 RepID=A0ABU8DSZ0_9ACTN